MGGAGGCHHDIQHDVRQLAEPEWGESFLEYYREERGFLVESIEAAAAAIGLSDEELEVLAEEATDELDEDAKGGFGEAHVSYILEANEGRILTHAAWKEEPFVGKAGVDLVAVHPETLEVTHTEVKLRAKASPGLKDLTLRALRKQLDLENLKDAYERRAGFASHLTISNVLKELIQDGRLEASLKEGVELDQGSFRRLGSVVASSTDPWDPIRKACPCDMTPEYPCRLVLIIVQDLKDRLEELAAYDLSAREAKNAS